MPAALACTIQHMGGPDPKDLERGDRLKALRKACRLTQEGLARRSALHTSQIAKVERGWNKASSHAVRDGLALGLGVPPRTLDAYLAGKVTLDRVLQECSNGSTRTPDEGVMGLALDSALVGMPNLEALARVNLAKRKWSTWAVRLAISGYFGKEDLTIEQWEEKLDELDGVLRRAASPSQTHAKRLPRSS